MKVIDREKMLDFLDEKIQEIKKDYDPKDKDIALREIQEIKAFVVIGLADED